MLSLKMEHVLGKLKKVENRNSNSDIKFEPALLHNLKIDFFFFFLVSGRTLPKIEGFSLVL